MNFKLKQVAFLLVVVAALASCGKKVPNEAKLIPKNASYVVVLDINSMHEKLKKGNVDFQTAVKEIMGNDTAELNKGLKEIEGLKEAIDWDNKSFLFIDQTFTAAGKEDATSFNVIGTLKDVAKFENFLKTNKDLKNEKIVKEANFSYLLKSSSLAISWNDKNVIFTGYEKKIQWEYDTSGAPIMPDMSKKEDELRATVKKYYTQKEEESIASVAIFKDMFNKKADGYMFSSTNNISGMLGALPFSTPKLKEMVKDNYSTGTFNFEDGKLVFDGDFYPNATVANLFKTYKTPEIKTDLLENYPSKNVNGFMLMSFDPQLFSGILKELEVKGLADAFLSKSGLSTDEIFKMMKGDIALAVSDFALIQPPPPPPGSDFGYYNPSPQPSYKMLLNIPVGDVAAYRKIMEKAIETNVIVKSGAVYKLNPQMQEMKGLYLQADDKNIILASDSATYSAYVAKTSKMVVDDKIMSKVKGKSGAFYLNLQSLIGGFANMISTPDQKKYYDIVNATFKDAYFVSEKFDGKKSFSEGAVTFKDEKQNSLVTVAKMFISLAKEAKAQETARTAMYRDMEPAVADSVAAVTSPTDK
jgi:hypothetical protein